MTAMPLAVLQNLEQGAKRLASHDLPYLAYLTLDGYAGECAEETKDARLRLAQTYLDYSHYLTGKAVGKPRKEQDFSDQELKKIISKTHCKWGYECLDIEESKRCVVSDFGSEHCLK